MAFFLCLGMMGWIMDSIAALREKLAQLREEHRDLDDSIRSLQLLGNDQLQVARLKKRKLGIKDQIALIESKLIPDIIA